VEGKKEPPYYDLKVGTKVGLQQMQMRSCQPIKRLKKKKKKKEKEKKKKKSCKFRLSRNNS
jgi:hypothetical protein